MYYDNFQECFLNELSNVLNGKEVKVRGSVTKELLMHSFTVDNPQQRVSILKGRNNNIFAQIAETLWMLAGRSDMDFLERYVPQCRTWSDDGETWRGAYGPRLRVWPDSIVKDAFKGIIKKEFFTLDQLQEVARKINGDKFTRQAIITIWDPAQDWVRASKDYPCNNWLHFIQRDGALHLNVAVRSNDVMFGFSHCDFFGWSVLQQLMAFWTKLEVGTLTWNATSFHLYEKHWDKAKEIVDAGWGKFAPTIQSVYHYGYSVPEVDTPFAMFDDTLAKIFKMEKEARASRFSNAWDIMSDLRKAYVKETAFLYRCAQMLLSYNAYLNGFVGDCAKPINDMPEIDFRMAAIEFYLRKYPEVMKGIYLTPDDTDYIKACGIELT